MKCVLTLSLLVLWAPSVHADDYSLSTEAWNGVGYLVTTGEEARVSVKTESTLDLSRLRPSEVLVWLYPTTALPVEDMLLFIQEGGHLIMADDAGNGGELFEAVGLTRERMDEVNEGQGATSTYASRAGMPILQPTSDHFLFFNVDRVVANHPAVLGGDGEVVLSAGSDGQGLIVEVHRGEGALLAVGDPSIFLNAMMRRFYGNKQLAANMMRYYCLQDPCEVRLLLPGTSVEGHYRSGLGRLGAIPRVLDEAVMLINRTLRDADRALSASPWPLVLVILILGLTIMVASSLLLGGRPIVEANRAWPEPGVSPLRHDVAALLARQDDADFMGPATVLLNEVTEGDMRSVLAASAEASAGAQGQPVRDAHEAVLRIRREADSVQMAESGPVSGDRFLRLLKDVRVVEQYLESTSRRTSRRTGRSVRRPVRNSSPQDT